MAPSPMVSLSGAAPDASAPTVGVEDYRLAGPRGALPLRLYRPLGAAASASPLPLVIYLHGGGFVAGSLLAAAEPARQLARTGEWLVLTVDYALAPDHPFPAALEDVHAAARWAERHARRLGVRAGALAVVGEEAGGNLAAGLALMARDRLGPTLAAQVLVSPMLDPSQACLTEWLPRQGGHCSDQERAAAQPLAEAAARCAEHYRQYLPEPRQRLHPYAAPLISRRLVALPPALIITGDQNLLCPEGEKYACALIGAGIPTQVLRLPRLESEGLARDDRVRHAVAAFLSQQF